MQPGKPLQLAGTRLKLIGAFLICLRDGSHWHLIGFSLAQATWLGPHDCAPLDGKIPAFPSNPGFPRHSANLYVPVQHQKRIPARRMFR